VSFASFSGYIFIQNLVVMTFYADSLVLHLQYEMLTKILNCLVLHHKYCEAAVHSEHPFPLVYYRDLQVVGMKISQIGMRHADARFVGICFFDLLLFMVASF
jgi:hypothetical protein